MEREKNHHSISHRLLFKYPGNKADVNTLNKDGLTAFHILLAQLIDLATLENKSEEARGPNPPKDEDIEVRRLFLRRNKSSHTRSMACFVCELYSSPGSKK